MLRVETAKGVLGLLGAHLNSPVQIFPISNSSIRLFGVCMSCLQNAS